MTMVIQMNFLTCFEFQNDILEKYKTQLNAYTVKLAFYEQACNEFLIITKN